MALKEKLEMAAREHALYSSVNWENFTWLDLEYSFKQGAEWMQSQPLSEKLTEEEMEEFNELRLYANYAYHWGNSIVECKKCGNLNPSGYICATCGWDNTYDPNEEC